MSQIEVPDWVARKVLAGYLRDWDDCSESNKRDLAKIMAESLTAALGAWVVPAGWMDPDDGSVVCEYHKHEPRYVSYTQPLFALRQEKPE